jgi:hypothetical protein
VLADEGSARSRSVSVGNGGVLSDDLEIIPPLCDWGLFFDSLEALEKRSSEFPPFCNQVYSLRVLASMLDGSLKTYDSEKKGYDGKFHFFEDAYRTATKDQLEEYLSWPKGPGLRFLHCKTERLSGPCPLPGFTFDDEPGWQMEFEFQDRAAFFKGLSSSYSIPEDWIELKDDEKLHKTTVSDDVRSHPLISTVRFKFINKPQLKKNFPVPNPKMVVEQIIGGGGALKTALLTTAADMMIGLWSEDGEDTVQALSLPALMAIQAISSMKEVKDISTKLEEKEKTNKALLITSLVLLLVPIAGEAGAVFVGAAGLGRLIAGFALAGNTGLSIYETVKDPANAVFILMGLVLQGLPLRGLGGRASGSSVEDSSLIGKAAAARKALIVNGRTFGELFKRKDAALQNVIGVCFRRKA